MIRTSVLADMLLTEAFGRANIGDKFFVGSRNGQTRDKSEQNRAYSCASCAGRQITMRKFRDGWKATVIE